jgi:hypothetical protein
MSIPLRFTEWLEERDNELHESLKRWIAGVGAGAALAAGAAGLLPSSKLKQPASQQIGNSSVSVEHEKNEKGQTYFWSFSFRNYSGSAQEAKKEAMNQVREELLRQFGRASGIVAEVQSDDGKGNIVVDVTQVNTSSVHAANND